MPPKKHKGKGLHISGTRMGLFNMCERKWAAQYVKDWGGGEPRLLPSSGAASYGTEVHRIAENWFNFGDAPPDTLEGRVFSYCIPHWPAPKSPGLRAEVPFKVEIHGQTLTGTMDILHEREDGSILIGDHKTTSSLSWAKTPSQLLADEQAMTYAWAMMEQCKVDELTMKWVYATRILQPWEIPNTKVIEFKVRREHVEGYWNEKLLPTAKKMLDLYAKGVHPADAKPNFTSCSAFGGCPYQKNCKELGDYKDMTKALDDLLALSSKPKEKQEEPKLVEPKTDTRPSKAAQQKAAIAALEAIDQSFRQNYEMMGKIYDTQLKVLEKLLEGLK